MSHFYRRAINSSPDTLGRAPIKSESHLYIGGLIAPPHILFWASIRYLGLQLSQYSIFIGGLSYKYYSSSNKYILNRTSVCYLGLSISISSIYIYIYIFFFFFLYIYIYIFFYRRAVLYSSSNKHNLNWASIRISGSN